MVSKNLRLNMSIDTNSAKKSMDDLENAAKRTGKAMKGMSTGGKDGTSTSNHSNSDPETKRIVEALEKNAKAYNDSISEFTKYLKRQSTYENGQPIKQSSPSLPNNNVPKDKPNAPKAPDENKIGSYIGKAIGAIISAKGISSYISQGMSASRNYQEEAVRIYNKTGAYGSNFEKSLTDAYKTGGKNGYTIGETLDTESRLMSATGFKDLESLQLDTDVTQKMMRASGTDAGSLSNIYGTLAKRGAYESGQADEVMQVVASSIKSSEMVGREDELIRAIQLSTDTLLSNKLNVTSEDFENTANVLNALGQQNTALKGEQGALLINEANQGLNGKDPMSLRLMGYGGELGHGADALLKAIKMTEDGFNSPETIAAFQRNRGKYGLADDTMATIVLNQNWGMSTEKAEELLRLDPLSVKGNKGIGQDYIDQNNANYQNSTIGTIDQYEADRENTNVTTGNAVNEALNPFRKIYSDMPAGAKFATDIAGKILPGIAVSKGSKYLGGLGKGGNAPGDFFKTAGRGIENFVTGKGSSQLMDDVINTSSRSMINLSDDLVGLGGKAMSVGGKAMGVLGKAVPYIPAAIGGVQAIGDFSKGDTKKGSEHLGEGLGALAGAAIGSVIPGLGTVIGGLIGGIGGGFFGKKAGGGIHDMITGEEDTKDKEPQNKRTNQILDKQEILLKKEEQLFDKFLGEGRITPQNSDGFNSRFSDDTESTFTQMSQSASDYLDKRTSDLSGGGISNFADVQGWNELPDDVKKALEDKLQGLPANQSNFIKSILPGAIDAYKNYGILPSVTIGQAIHESGWGKSGLTQNANAAFGIKATRDWKGKTYNSKTFEYGKGGKYYTNADFRAYDSLSDSVADHGKFLKENSRYADVFNKTTGYDQIAAIKKAGYATDPAYISLVDNIAKSNNLYDIDKLIQGTAKSSYAVGTPYVTEDKQAFLHKEEAVLNKYDARAYREGRLGSANAQSSQIDLNININANDGVDPNLVNMIKAAVAQAMAQMNLNSGINLAQAYGRTPI